jgi:hypothetical protein
VNHQHLAENRLFLRKGNKVYYSSKRRTGKATEVCCPTSERKFLLFKGDLRGSA